MRKLSSIAGGTSESAPQEKESALRIRHTWRSPLFSVFLRWESGQQSTGIPQLQTLGDPAEVPSTKLQVRGKPLIPTTLGWKTSSSKEILHPLPNCTLTLLYLRYGQDDGFKVFSQVLLCKLTTRMICFTTDSCLQIFRYID